MANFSHHYYTASPVLVIPQPCYQTQLSAGTFGRHQSPLMQYNAAPTVPAQATPARSGGRKRSRDEASINLEPDPQPVAIDDPQKDWIYGPGMVLIKPATGYVTDASSQSGTWVEEATHEKQKAVPETQSSQLETRSHKSQRLDCAPDNSSARIPLHCAPSSRTQSNSSGNDFNNTVVIDNFTFHLGIGWRKISDDEHIQAAARGWARFIENNFGLSNVQVCLESKGLQSYLVEASEGYFLFAENLRQGRLVSRTAEGALQNLKLLPPRFEGPELVLAKSKQHVGFFTDTAMAIDQ
ncbi:hypothetical protein QQS21_003872 [Conoideocrella luteorostrata]|uniref:Uncharacterized protein n=1 Tax=Conoideocrella luteorostrata TaxID=1105319 RepID=A0AAJ0CSJ5_9HYPO|nr:hypothetical protein QQS21_003872 [Conoideocrella luteorostrata]